MTSTKHSFDLAGLFDFLEDVLAWVKDRDGRYLLVNSVLARFKGMTENESKPIIDYLMAHSVRPEYTCRVRWETGTLTMWANPFVLHTAINDYPGYRRVTYRTSVEGHVPQRAVAERDEAKAMRAA